jgi:hypothetical protein
LETSEDGTSEKWKNDEDGTSEKGKSDEDGTSEKGKKMSHPTAAQLLGAVQLFLKEAEGQLSGRLAFHAKVAANALATVERELAQNPDAAEAAAFAPHGGLGAVCAGLRDGSLSPQDPALLKAIRASVLARLAVDNPRYATFKRLDAREIA